MINSGNAIATGGIGNDTVVWGRCSQPFCITVDFETENDNCVTVRHRDSMEQECVSLKDLSVYRRVELL